VANQPLKPSPGYFASLISWSWVRVRRRSITSDSSYGSNVLNDLNCLNVSNPPAPKIEPESPEVEYGWIEPRTPIVGYSRVFGVRRFWEKPNPLLAQVLQLRGCLWNSFVMVASVRTLLETIASAIPQLYHSFLCVAPAFGTSGEAKLIDRLYQAMGEITFSHQVLALCPEQLAVLNVTGVRWDDLGEPNRVMASLDMAGVRPHWLEASLPQFA